MKYILILLFLISCGPQEGGDSNNRVGDIWALQTEQNFSIAEISKVRSICQSLSKKSSYLELVVIPNAQRFNFDVVKTSCYNPESTSVEIEAEAINVSTMINKTSQGLFFSNYTGLYSSQLIDHKNSIISGICNKVLSNSENISKVQKSGELAVLYKLSNDSKCDSNKGQCFSIIYGKKYDGSYYKTISQLILTINTDTSSSRNGVIEKLVHESEASCEQEGAFESLEQTVSAIN